MDKNKFTVCIRSSGEFTTDRLHKDIVRQIGSNEKVYLIKNNNCILFENNFLAFGQILIFETYVYLRTNIHTYANVRS